jgi:pseudouridine-5'-phosphate glycosidase
VKWDLGITGGAIIGNPIPEVYSMPKEEINDAIEAALRNAAELGIKGKEITPFLLDAIKTLTDGRSLVANMQLVLSNARLAAETAVKYTAL